jgi:hypothetical protein
VWAQSATERLTLCDCVDDDVADSLSVTRRRLNRRRGQTTQRLHRMFLFTNKSTLFTNLAEEARVRNTNVYREKKGIVGKE